MKLSIEQIAIIENTLFLNGLKFDDLKLELTDHIASEIEEAMDTNPRSFEENLKAVFNKWSEQLKPSSYQFLLGRLYSGPRIVMNKMQRYSRVLFLKILLFSIPLTLVTFGLIHFLDSKIIIDTFSKIMKRLYLFEVFLVVIAWIIIFKNKKITTFSYQFKKRSFLVFFQPLLIGLGIMPLKLLESHWDIQIVFIFFLYSFFLFFILDFTLVFKHLKIVKKLSLSNS